MTLAFHDPAFEELPDAVAVFPLTGAFLLPGGYLPLNVFEPRYLSLLDKALSGNRLIGMVQPEKPTPDPVPGDAALYPIGCLGRIVSFEESGDGPVGVSLKGVIRFNIVRELAPDATGFRRVLPDFKAFRQDLQEGPETLPDRDRLMAAAERYFDHKDIHIDWESIEDIDGADLVTALAMICPLEPREKQALLEVAGHPERARMLSSLMEMARLGASGPSPRLRH